MEKYNQAKECIAQMPDGHGKRFTQAVLDKAAMEIMRCMDPRHGTTLEQADEAVMTTSPFAELLTFVESQAGAPALRPRRAPTSAPRC